MLLQRRLIYKKQWYLTVVILSALPLINFFCDICTAGNAAKPDVKILVPGYVGVIAAIPVC
jgi:hypothetical protein